MIYEDEDALDETESESRGTRESTSGAVAIALVAGAAIGAAVALMFAPKSGTEMRRVIRKRADGLRETAGNVFDDTADEVGRELRRRTRQIRRKLDRMA
jgi:gas vesicle protein